MLARKQSAIYGIAKLGHSLLATYGKKIFRNLKEARHFLRSLKLLIVFFILWESDDFLPKKILEACILQRKSSHSYSRASSSGEKGINFEDDDHHDDEIAGSPTALEIECIELHPTLSVQSTLIQNGGFDDVTEIEISRRNDLLSPIISHLFRAIALSLISPRRIATRILNSRISSTHFMQIGLTGTSGHCANTRSLDDGRRA